MKYKIKVSWSWVYDDIEAESWPEAKHKALSLAGERVEQDNMIAEEYEAPKDWREIAQQEAKTIAEEMELAITEAVKKWKKENKKGGMYQLDDDIAGEIYDAIYQSEDVVDKAWQAAERYFIYNSSDALKKAMDCINRLNDYASGDNELWEGKTEYWDITNIQAYDALQGAIISFTEDEIKSKIISLLNK